MDRDGDKAVPDTGTRMGHTAGTQMGTWLTPGGDTAGTRMGTVLSLLYRVPEGAAAEGVSHM